MWNLLADYKVISAKINGRSWYPKWQYTEALNSLQEEIGLRFANKLKRKHVDWTEHKMNVELDAQTLSASVASATDFLQDESNVPEFEGSEETAQFIWKKHMAFDVLNSRNPFAKGLKASVTKHSLPTFEAVCQDLYQYIFNLRDESGQYLCNSRRKTCLLEFAFILQPVILLCKELLTCTSC